MIKAFLLGYAVLEHVTSLLPSPFSPESQSTSPEDSFSLLPDTDALLWALTETQHHARFLIGSANGVCSKSLWQ